MLKTETIEINGIKYKRTYSDTHTIKRGGVEYTEAVDPYESDRVYEETENKLEDMFNEESISDETNVSDETEVTEEV